MRVTLCFGGARGCVGDEPENHTLSQRTPPLPPPRLWLCAQCAERAARRACVCARAAAPPPRVYGAI
jgi:hypothetical protein